MKIISSIFNNDRAMDCHISYTQTFITMVDWYVLGIGRSKDLICVLSCCLKMNEKLLSLFSFFFFGKRFCTYFWSTSKYFKYFVVRTKLYVGMTDRHKIWQFFDIDFQNEIIGEEDWRFHGRWMDWSNGKHASPKNKGRDELLNEWRNEKDLMYDWLYCTSISCWIHSVFFEMDSYLLCLVDDKHRCRHNPSKTDRCN